MNRCMLQIITLITLRILMQFRIMFKFLWGSSRNPVEISWYFFLSWHVHV